MNSRDYNPDPPKAKAAIPPAPRAAATPPFAGSGAASTESLAFTVELPARNRGLEGGNGSGNGRSADGTKAQRRTDPAGDWRGGIVFAIVGIVAGSGPGMEPRGSATLGMGWRARHGCFADDGLHRVEPKRDFAESDQGAVIMLAGSGDDCRSCRLALVELSRLAAREVRAASESRKFAMSELSKFAVSESEKFASSELRK